MTATAVTLGRTIVCFRDLVPLIDARPAGAKLDVPALVKALTPTQADVVTAIRGLVEEGALDPQTLRSPAPATSGRYATAVAASARPTGQVLFRQIEAAVAARATTLNQASVEIFGRRQQIYTLKGATLRPVHKKTLDRVAAWLAQDLQPNALNETGQGPQSDAGDNEAGGGSTTPPASIEPGAAARPTVDGGTAAAEPAAAVPESPLPPAPRPTGADLADQLEAYMKRHDLALRRVGRHLFNGEGYVGRLRYVKRPGDDTIARVLAFVAAPPLPELKRQEPGGVRKGGNSGLTGAELAAELDAAIADQGLSKTAVGKILFCQGSGVEQLRRVAWPRNETVAKVRALIADPPTDARLALRRPAEKQVAPPAKKLEPDPDWTPPKPVEPPAPVVRRLVPTQTAARKRDVAAAQKHIDAGTMAPPGRLRMVQLGLEGQQREAERLADPVAAAQLTLQRRNKTVYRASVVGRSPKRFVVSGVNRDVTEAELQQLAAGTLTSTQINEGGTACHAR